MAPTTDMSKETITEQEIIRFVDDGQVQAAGLNKPVVGSLGCIQESGKEIRDHTVKDFMMRPNLLGTVAWSSDQTPATKIVTYNIPEDLFNKPLIREKIEGFTFFRASTVFKIQCNATPFMQGRLLAVFVPYGGNRRSVFSALSHLGGITGFPHVDLDLSTHQTMTLKIPFVSPLTHLNLVRGYGQIGQLQLFVYGPLVSSEASSIQISTWAWFDDVEIEVPSGLPISNFTPVNMQSGEGGVSDVAEINAKIPLPPLLTNLGNGLSKPVSSQAPMIMQPSLQRNFANGLGIDTTKTFSMAPVTGVSRFKGKFGTSQDEMDINYICRTPTFFRAFDWLTADAAGKQLTNIPVHPMICPVSAEGSNMRDPTLISYVTSCFRYWSGSLIFTFKFVKTNFHSGRVRCVFTPGMSIATQTPDVSKCYSQVFDLREKCEFSIKIPYVASQPWSATSSFASLPDATPWRAPFDNAVGSLQMIVLNELRAPGVTANSVRCLVEIAGGEDYCLAVPYYQGAIPYSPNLPAKYTGEEEADEIVEMQGFEDIMTRDECQAGDCEPIPLFETSTSSNDKCKDMYCIGERVSNIRTILKRNMFMQETDNHRFLRILPYYVGRTVTPTVTDTNDRNYNDYYSWFSYIYAFTAGGMRLKMLNQTPAVDYPFESQLFMNKNPNTAVTTAIVAVNINEDLQKKCFPRTIHFPGKEGAIEIEIPYFKQTYATPSFAYLPTSRFDLDPTRLKTNGVVVGSIHDAEQAWTCWRSVADDFEFGYLIGAPKVALISVDDFVVP